MEYVTEKLIEWSTLYGTKVVGALAILVLGRLGVGLVTNMVRRLMRKSEVDETLTSFAGSLIRIFLLAFIVIAALSALGVQTSSLIAIIGAAGLAVGLALQSSLSNFASGIMLIVFRPFRVGDYVEAGGSAGIVEEIHIFSSILRSLDNRKIVVPNSRITGDNITNYTAKDTRRVDLVFGISYDDDIRRAREILQQIVSEDNRILADPAPDIAVLELADSCVNFAVRPWVKGSDFWSVRCDLLEKVKLAFDDQGITIPFPQREVHLHQSVAS